MRLTIIGLILLAFVAAGGAALTAKRYLDSQAKIQTSKVAQKVEEPAIYVVVADRRIAVGTTLTKSAMRWQKWPDDAVEAMFISAYKKDNKVLRKFVGAMTRQSIAAGTPMTEDMVFRRGKAGFLSGIVDEGLRAVSLKVDVVSGVGGFILPGDRVDVLVTFDARQLTQNLEQSSASRGEEGRRNESYAERDVGPAKYSSETILKNVRVLGIDQSFKDVEGEASVVKSVTMEVSPKQAEVLAVGRAMGKLSLALRSWAGNGTGTQSGTYTADVDISPTLQSIMSRLSDKGRRKSSATPSRFKGILQGGQRATRVRIVRGDKEVTQEFPTK